jgi:hypothetical protein
MKETRERAISSRQDFYGAYAEARALLASIPGVPVTYLFGAQQVLAPE